MQEISIIVGIIVSLLTIIGAVSGFFSRTYEYLIRDRANQAAHRVPRRTIVIVPSPFPNSVFWSTGSIGNSPAMHVVGRFNVTNVTRVPILLAVAKLRRPRLLGYVSVRKFDANIYGRYPIPPGATTDLSFDFLVSPPVRKPGEDFIADVDIVDQFGNEHRIKTVAFKCLG